MWTTLIGVLRGLFEAVGAFVQWRREEQLREDGAAREALENYERAHRARSIADEIDQAPVPNNPALILDGLRRKP